jgi:leucyl-tRNA synthetase
METTEQSQRAASIAYDHAGVEAKWRERWAERQTYKADLDGAARPFYNLMMFPYPSAEGLHTGHCFTFSGADAHGRLRRMQGHEVFQPMGWDAFGIHSENYALKVNQHPARLTPRTIANFKRQMTRLGAGFDWSHELSTTDPAYYRWTQWIFVQLMKRGLAVQKEATVNWCPKDMTVLADEQVIQGRCERCDSVVERRVLRQWFLRITEYAQQLLDGLDTIDWSEVVVTAQRNWIGRSEGAMIRFDLERCERKDVTVFTTRPDTLYGATFLVVGADHPNLFDFVAPERRQAVERWREELPAQAEEPDFSIGIDLGSEAVHPLTEQRLPVYAAPYVLGGYGTGAIMAVPAHDERDWQFARAHRLPIVEVIGGGDPEQAAYSGHGVMVNSGEFTALQSEEGKRRIVARLQEMGRGEPAVQFRLRDWLISRQRYWGPPIPVIHCEKCGPVPVPEDQLPVLLPDVEDFKPIGTGVSPLAMVEEWVNVSCPQCGGPGRRETDVSDTFLDSSWYFLRYPSTEFDDRPFDKGRTWKWLPVSIYIGGKEHSVLHLLYSRFVMRALFDADMVPAPEPFPVFRAHGMIIKDGAKMSKSRGNVVSPDEYMDRYGADTLRVYLLFLGPYDLGGDFRDEGIAGAVRFLNRVWRIGSHGSFSDGANGDDTRERRRHALVKGVSERMENMRYNTAIALLMSFADELTADAARNDLRRADVETLLQLLAPLAPHLTEELWEQLGHDGSIHRSQWPAYDEALAAAREVTIAVQVNGKPRSTLTVTAGTDAQMLERQARELPRIAELLAGATVRKVVAVPDRIVNFVVG